MKMDIQDPFYYQNESETSSGLKNLIGNSSNLRLNHATRGSGGSSPRPNLINSLSSRRRQEMYNSSEPLETSRRPSYTQTDAERPNNIDPTGIAMSDKKSNRSIPERVESIYYTLGLFCSSHPLAVILLAAVVVIISWYGIKKLLGS
jgi:hypothetical protein